MTTAMGRPWIPDAEPAPDGAAIVLPHPAQGLRPATWVWFCGQVKRMRHEAVGRVVRENSRRRRFGRLRGARFARPTLRVPAASLAARTWGGRPMEVQVHHLLTRRRGREFAARGGGPGFSPSWRDPCSDHQQQMARQGRLLASPRREGAPSWRITTAHGRARRDEGWEAQGNNRPRRRSSRESHMDVVSQTASSLMILPSLPVNWSQAILIDEEHR